MTQYEQIDTLAERLVSKIWGAKVPINVEGLAKKLGVTVIKSDPSNDNLSGMLVRGADVKILVNSSHPETRQRFSLAHELGHLKLHKGKEMFINKDKAGYLLRSSEPTDIADPQLEKEANVFAASLLMPKTLIEKHAKLFLRDGFDGNELISKMAEKFNVSTQAMGFRLMNLGYEFH